MTLKFADQVGQYNPHTDNVRFFGEDGAGEVMFAVSREKLAELEGVKTLDEKGAVKAATRQRNRLRTAAERAYREIGPGSAHAYELTAKYFDVAAGDENAPDTSLDTTLDTVLNSGAPTISVA